MTTIRIKQYAFALRDLYREGTVLTKPEAQALNGLRAENIRNNFAKRVQSEIEAMPDGKTLSEEKLEELQIALASYEANYQFPLRHTPGERPGVIEKEAFAIAEDEVYAAARAQGRIGQIEDLTEEQISELQAASEALAKTPAVRDEARRRIEARQKIASAGLEDLL